MATKTERRRLARQVRNDLGIYLTQLTPHIEQYAEEHDIDIRAARISWIDDALVALSKLAAAERETP
jgi:hypothetical protein